MPAKGIKETRVKMNRIMEFIAGPKAEKAVREALIIIEGAAMSMVPIDTGFLANSRFREVTVDMHKVAGRIGFTAEYAAALHAKTGVNKGKSIPRATNDPSRGNQWDPDAEPHFLEKGAEESRAAIDAVIKKNMRI